MMVPEDDKLLVLLVRMLSIAEWLMPCMRVDLVMVGRNPLQMVLFKNSVQYWFVWML
jgi:hypothetical protein